MEWTIVTVIGALIGLFSGIALPIVKLTSAVTKFSTLLDGILAQLKKDEAENKDEHQKICDHDKSQDDRLNEHEQRIGILEHDHFRQFPSCADGSCNPTHT